MKINTISVNLTFRWKSTTHCQCQPLRAILLQLQLAVTLQSEDMNPRIPEYLMLKLERYTILWQETISILYLLHQLVKSRTMHGIKKTPLGTVEVIHVRGFMGA